MNVILVIGQDLLKLRLVLFWFLQLKVRQSTLSNCHAIVMSSKPRGEIRDHLKLKAYPRRV